jgi:opacity protein-like surface antigen
MKGIIIFLVFLISLINFQALYAHNNSVGSMDYLKGFFVKGGVNYLTRDSDIAIKSTTTGETFFKGSDSGSTPGLSLGLGYRHTDDMFFFSTIGMLRYFPGTSSGVVFPAADLPRVTTNLNLSLEFNLGVSITSNAAIYATLGLSGAKHKVRYLWNATNTRVSKFRMGPSYGVGCDIALDENFIFGLQYLHTDYKRFNIADPGNTAIARVFPGTNVVELSLSYQFDNC